VEEDEARLLAGFRARFGRKFDARREATPSPEVADRAEASGTKAEDNQRLRVRAWRTTSLQRKRMQIWLVSSFGQESGARSHKKSGGKGK
jgi:hypothetical protein